MINWQKDLLERLEGMKPGEMKAITASGRRVGKSQLMKLWRDVYHEGHPSLRLHEGTVYGETYYTVECYGYIWDDLHKWCVESFGPTHDDGVWEPSQRWYENNSAFWFRETKDRDWFVMRWS